jgi:muconolactone delta-isomerase
MWLIFMPRAVNFDVLDITQPIHYWSVITPSLNKWLLLLVFLVSFVIAMVLIYLMWKRDTIWAFYFIIAAILISILFTVAATMNLWMDTNSIEHIQSIAFQGKEYRLALSHLWDGDHEYANYNILECDPNGDICQPIKQPLSSWCSYMNDDIKWASLNTNRDMLSLNCGEYKIPILPPVNGSS